MVSHLIRILASGKPFNVAEPAEALSERELEARRLVAAGSSKSNRPISSGQPLASARWLIGRRDILG